MIWVFLILNIILLLEICISIYMISYYKKQKLDFFLDYFKMGLKSYLFVMIAGLILAVVNAFILILVSSETYRLTVEKMFHRLQFILLLLVL